MALTIWGTRAGGGPYAALAALTNIPATILGALFYEFILMDSSRGKLWSSLSHYLNVDHLTPCLSVITSSHAEFLAGHLAHAEHKEQSSSARMGSGSPSTYTSDDKAQIEAIERA
ncbi:hypothetical protein PHLCEN_2v11000 [Hermanssonia centrifuga]|uniref:Uncharacterized protein n=1 Tax=Hermanssonia centrifuga TaxID=98765 RepID=A0A2R6NLB2_9APHY|nr:hypothetical protein PHLCEN_2v11000 [Hermanssonia centrifuga]